MRKSGLTGDEAYALSKRRGTTEDLGPLKKEISLLKEDLSNKITKFYASNQGETHLADSDNGKIQDMMIYGKSSQDGTPSLENPVEIKSVVNPVIKICGKNLFDSKKFPIILNRAIDTNTGKIYESLSGNYYATEKYIHFPYSGKKVSFNASMSLCAYDKDYKFINTVNRNNGQVPIGTMYVRFDIKTAEKDKAQIELSENATTYEPYKEQTIQLTIILNSIPVSSGGNVTINGQQYIADRVVEKDGVFGIERNIREIHTNTKTMNSSEMYPGWNKVEGISDTIYYNESPIGDSRRLCSASNFTNSSIFQNNVNKNNVVYYIQSNIGYSQSELIAKAIDVDMYIRLQDAIFEPLPADIQVKLQTFVTYYPVTNISVTSDQLDGYAVFNYPISMQNGWNYVKQQLNDNRDYIYDMDTQSAEAYINSEYAVALTELEV